jgi:periplasmic protein TonB
MFEQSLLESTAAVRSHRGLATSISALAQLTLLAIAVLLPMIFTQTMPLLKTRYLEPVLIPHSVPRPEPPPTDPGPSQNSLATGAQTIVVNNPFLATRSPAFDRSGPDPEIPQPWGIPGADARNLPIGSVSTTGVSGPKGPVRISILNEGRIIRKVTPAYPVIARNAGVQGQVVLEAVISRAGRIENLRTVSGHPWLVQAAKAAVNQWEFRPYILNGTPIEVMTQITVDFKLDQY